MRKIVNSSSACMLYRCNNKQQKKKIHMYLLLFVVFTMSCIREEITCVIYWLHYVQAFKTVNTVFDRTNAINSFSSRVYRNKHTQKTSMDTTYCFLTYRFITIIIIISILQAHNQRIIIFFLFVCLLCTNVYLLGKSYLR